MNKKTILLVIGALLIIAAVTAGVRWQSRQSIVAMIPSPDTTQMEQMEQPVAAAIKNARAKVLQDPDKVENWSRLGKIFHAHDLYEAALACYEKAGQLNPGNYAWPYLAAQAQLKIDREKAVAYFETAAAHKPRNSALYITYGDTLTQLGDAQRAETQYEIALQLDKRSSFARLGLARVQLLAGNVEKARSLLEEARKLLPRHGEVHSLLAQVYLQLGDDEKAREAEWLSSAYPNPLRPDDPPMRTMESMAVNSRGLTEQATALAARGEYAAAETLFRKVLSLRPGTAVDYSNLAAVLARQGKTEQADKAFRDGLAVEPDNAEVLSNFSLTLIDQSQVRQAQAMLEKAIAADPTFAPAQFNMGLLLERGKQPAKAALHYREAIRLDPSMADAYLNLGSALAAEDDLDGAVAQWQRLLQIDPNRPAAIFNMALAQIRLGRHTDAMRTFEKGLAIAPNSSRFVSAMAWQLATSPEQALRDGQRAENMANRLLQARGDDPRINDLAAAASAENGNFADAIRQAERALVLSRNAGDLILATEIGKRLALYRKNKPYHQPAAIEVGQQAPVQ